ncbi:MarR family winged helix-turn-helix transcriptional regulator [Gordonia hydrophobica]|uniref:MarR family transcriptional regulator n=1 Tax=Gordonia hydrophobica TaxID=40516 RepID=A0ABZ2U561_9ACTN|nr:MarR family transcriptional regulator [Gordonia hydrophobica]MBM7368709.1 DNA-binding MarR family transcriptional regulator [Gordonia hydrophobica]
MDDHIVQLREDITVFNRKIRSQAARHLLTPSQVQTLAHVDRIGPVSARALADVEMIAPQSVARTVASLEALGLVTRDPDPNDGRAVLITITDSGHQTLETDRAQRSRWLADAIDATCTPVERELLFLAGTLLRRIATGHEPETSGGEA